jgi:hypothetical protein
MRNLDLTKNGRLLGKRYHQLRIDMKNILGLLALVVVLTSCNDPMGLNSPLNKQLDSTIANRIFRLKADTSSAKDLIQGISIDVSKVDLDIRGFWTRINLFDACTRTSEKADKYFDDWILKLHLDQQIFIKATELHLKPEIIVAIKTNELKLLDRILLEKH